MKYVLVILWLAGLLAGSILTAVGAEALGNTHVTGAAVGFFMLWALMGIIITLLIADGEL